MIRNLINGGVVIPVSSTNIYTRILGWLEIETGGMLAYNILFVGKMTLGKYV